jgi:hypothetical protein
MQWKVQAEGGRKGQIADERASLRPTRHNADGEKLIIIFGNLNKIKFN